MSGICAVVRMDGGPVTRARVERALGTMGGPVEVGSFAWIADAATAGLGAVVMGHGADASAAAAHAGPLTVVADARIDNHAGIAAALGLSPSSTSDAALILAAYRKWGDRCAERLVGEFAVLVWDGDARRLWCARDAIGHRTLAWRQTRGCLAIASSPRAVPRLDGGDITLDLDKVGQFLIHAEDRDRTFYEGVRRLGPGHVLAADAAGVRVRRYWSLQDIAPVRLPSDDAYVEAFRAIWREAVRCRLPDEGPTGVMLSAGLDSSSVAVAAAALLAGQGRLQAYHAAPRTGSAGAVRGGWIADEAEDVRAITALSGNIDLEVVRPGGRSFLDGADALFAQAAVPPTNADNRHWFEEILARAQLRGVTTMLGGFKGNATLSYTGIRALREWAYTGHWRLLLREARALGAARGRRTRAIVREAFMAGLPEPLYELARGARGQPRTPLLEALPTAMRPEFAAERPVEAWAATIGLDPRRPDRSTGRQYRTRIIGRIGDAADMYRGLRALYGMALLDPTTDVRVVEFCLGIPGRQYLRGGRDRQLVRRAMQGLLPDRVLERPTRGAQGADWHERLTRLRSRMAEAIEELEGSPTVRACIDLPRLRRLLADWPAVDSVEAQVDYRFRLTSGIMVGSFIRWFEADRMVDG